MADNEGDDPEAARAQVQVRKFGEMFSEEHVRKCLALAQGDPVRGVELVLYSEAVSTSLRSAIGQLELKLRSTLHAVVSAELQDPNWLFNPKVVDPSSAGRARRARRALEQDARRKGRLPPSLERVHERLSFGFWVGLISSDNSALWETAAHKAFNASGVAHAGRETIHDELVTLRDVRNNVSHLEHVLDQDLSKVYDTTVRLAEQLSPGSGELVRFNSRFPEVHPVERLSLDRQLPEGTRAKVLQLACTVTDRIGSSYPFDPAHMCTVIQEMLVSAEDQGNVPQEEVGQRAMDIARPRAEADCRAEMARSVSRQASRSGTPLLEHELQARHGKGEVFYRTDQQRVYDAKLETALQRVRSSIVEPAPLEIAVAKMAVCARRDAETLERSGDLGQEPEKERAWERVKVTEVLEQALSGGSVPDGHAIMKEREGLLSELQKPWERLGNREMQQLQQRFYRSFTNFELDCMCRGTGGFMWSMPNEQHRSQALKNLETLHQAVPARMAPWRSLHQKNSYAFPGKEMLSRIPRLAASR